MTKLAMIALGGAVGALLRYGVGVWSGQHIGTGFPWGTLIVNLLGAFVIGVLAALMQRTLWADWLVGLVMVGLLGAFTTFSTFSLEAVTLFREGATAKAVLYLGVSNIGGIALAAFGFWLGSILTSSPSFP
ncbi:MAG: fluoride efflux transporter CrcB [Rhodothermales bacterium]